MKYIAESKNVKMSPRKVRLIVDGIKTLPVERAVAVLSVSNKRAAIPVRKTLLSAIANAVNNGKVARADLIISEMMVNEGLAYKRYHYAARGRIRPYKKRTSHLRVILDTKVVNALPAPKVAEVSKKEAKEEKTVKAKKGKEKISSLRAGAHLHIQ